jgi:hypothetical protein
MAQNDERTALQKLLDEPKGKIGYSAGEAFLLHVFWESPNLEKATLLLDALEKCANATNRDTPCVPTYFFRLSNNDKDLYGEAPKLVKDHKTLASAIRKLQVGVARHAVTTEIVKQGLDPTFLDLELESELPPALQNQKPVAVEFTELYLDERAFMEHAGSKDYLQGYGTVMSPGMTNSPPITMRLGTPKGNLIEMILEPMLKECVCELEPGYRIWQCPSASDFGMFLSLDFPSPPTLAEIQEQCVWSVSFHHPLRENTVRFMAVVPTILTESMAKELSLSQPIRGEIHTLNETTALESVLLSAGLNAITINATSSSGYVLHGKASVLKAE